MAEWLATRFMRLCQQSRFRGCALIFPWSCWVVLLGCVTHHTNHDQETFLVLRCVRPSDDIFTTCCSHQEQISFRMYHRQRGGLVLPACHVIPICATCAGIGLPATVTPFGQTLQGFTGPLKLQHYASLNSKKSHSLVLASTVVARLMN